MIKNYKVTKSKYYSEDRKKLFSSYFFEYYSLRVLKWCVLKNVDMKDYLKNLILSDNIAVGEEISIDFDLKAKIQGGIK